MRRRFIVFLTLLFVLFGIGGAVAFHQLWQSSAELEELIHLYEIEDMRQDLELQIRLAEQALEVSGTVFANNSDEVVATVRELEHQMQACGNCHHEGRSQRLINQGIEAVDDYKKEFSQFFTAIGDTEWRQRLQIEVAAIGRRLNGIVREIRHVATPGLKRHTLAAKSRIDTSRRVLAVTLTLVFLSALLLASNFMRRATAPINKLIDAASRIGEGELGVVIEHRERGRMGRLLNEFNDMSRVLESQGEEVLQRTEEMLQTRDIALQTLARLAESRDQETGHHLERIACYCEVMAQALGNSEYAPQIDDRFIEQLIKSSPLHDIGKVGVADAILRKPGPLTDAEFDAMRKHAAIGGDTLRSVIDEHHNHTFLEMAMEIAYSHHEKWDGSGYPRGLAGDEIPLSARIVALADAYDAITSKRVYKKAHGHEEAIRRLLEDSGRHFDPVLIDVFLACQRDFDAIRKSFDGARGGELRSKEDVVVAFPTR